MLVQCILRGGVATTSKGPGQPALRHVPQTQREWKHAKACHQRRHSIRNASFKADTEPAAAGFARSAAKLNEVMQEITQEIYCDAAASHVSGDCQEPQSSLISTVLKRHLKDLDEGFLLVLNQSIEACQEDDETVVGELLKTTKQELMSALNQHFSPTIKALVDLAAIPNRADRLKALTSLLCPRVHVPRQDQSGGEATQQPHRETPSLESVAYTTLQVIEDMENSAPVLNSRLLAQLCVLVLDMEELAAAEAVPITKAGRPTRLALLGSFYPRVGEVPDTLMGFLKELLHVARQSKRRGLLLHAFERGWDGIIAPSPPAPKKSSPRPATESASNKAPRTAEDPGHSMRPLRFLQTLSVVSQELERRLSRVERDASGDALQHAALAAQIAARDGPLEPVQERLRDIERDVGAVLSRMAWPEQADWEDME